MLLNSSLSPYALPICIAIALYALYRRLLPKPLPGIAYNPEATRSLLGDAPAMAREIGKTKEFSKWLASQVMRMQSPVCQVFVLPFQKPWILLADYREAQDILLRRHGVDFDKPHFFSDGLAAMGDWHVRLPTNHEFRARRRLKQDLMTPTFLNTYMGPFFHGHALKLMQLFDMKIALAKGRPFSVLHDYDHVALDSMLHWAFGSNIEDRALEPQLEVISKLTAIDIPPASYDTPVDFPEAELSPFLVALQTAPDIIEKTMVSGAPLWVDWVWSFLPSYRTIFGQKNKSVPEQIEKAISNHRADVVQSAVEHILERERQSAEKMGVDPNFRRANFVDEIFADILAGHHTTGGTMCWTSKFLTGYPEVQRKLRASLYAAVPNAVAQKRPPTFDEIRMAKTPYLEAVLEEQLRLTPFSMAREAVRDTVVLGRHIPKGCQVMIVNAGPGYLSPAFPVDDSERSPTSLAAKAPGRWDESFDMTVFDPERWLIRADDGSVEFNASAGPQLGFGGGIRQCWGRRMAHLEVRTVMFLILWHFEFLEIPDALAGYDGIDGISRSPQRAYLRLARVEPTLGE